MTSNLGSSLLAEHSGDITEKIRKQVMDIVRSAFRPEFLNRIDEILLFRRLSREDMNGIVKIQLQRLSHLLKDRKISLDVDDLALTWLGDQGYDPTYGARPLKRVIQRELQNPLAVMILEGKIHDGQTIPITAGKKGLEIEGG
jgi:ATP-dependent Clp protease ATP-binding subunit ClpB